MIIDTGGDVTGTTDDGKEQPWLFAGCDPQPKGMPINLEPENEPAAMVWAKIGQCY